MFCTMKQSQYWTNTQVQTVLGVRYLFPGKTKFQEI